MSDHLGAAESHIRSARRRLRRGNNADAYEALLKAIRHCTKVMLKEQERHNG
jgi:hypothetical protein